MPDMTGVQDWEGKPVRYRRGGFLLLRLLSERAVRRYAYKLGYQLSKRTSGYTLVHVHTGVVCVGATDEPADLVEVAYYLHRCDRDWSTEDGYLDGRGLRHYPPDAIYCEDLFEDSPSSGEAAS